MTPVIENAVLDTDLDCQNFNLLNVGNLIPVPSGLVDLADPALSDPRVPPIASVTNESVNAVAAIDQSKLALNSVIPVPWLGTGSSQAAKGILTELIANKNFLNGYAGLDANGKMLPANVPATATPGTINTVRFSFPPTFNVPGDTVTSTGTVAATWITAPDGSWLGVNGPDDFTSDFVPSFLTGELPDNLVPPLSAAKFTTGVFDVDVLPPAVGMSLNPGITPDPGNSGHETDYLGRDMQWHTFQADTDYQPFCPEPLITLDSWSQEEVLVTVRSTLKGSSVFYRINTGPIKLGKVEHHGEHHEDTHDTISVQDGDRVWAYAARAGYNNSNVINWLVVTPLTGT